MKIDYVSIGKRIRILRKKFKLTQEQLAERAGISAVYISRIENGKTKMSLETLLKLSLILKVNLDYLLSGIYIDTCHSSDDITTLLQKCSSKTLRVVKKILPVLIEEQEEKS